MSRALAEGIAALRRAEEFVWSNGSVSSEDLHSHIRSGFPGMDSGAISTRIKNLVRGGSLKALKVSSTSRRAIYQPGVRRLYTPPETAPVPKASANEIPISAHLFRVGTKVYYVDGEGSIRPATVSGGVVRLYPDGVLVEEINIDGSDAVFTRSDLFENVMDAAKFLSGLNNGS